MNPDQNFFIFFWGGGGARAPMPPRTAYGAPQILMPTPAYDRRYCRILIYANERRSEDLKYRQLVTWRTSYA